jgi:PBP1b-binding outer membrane lipoprotein LpoB
MKKQFAAIVAGMAFLGVLVVGCEKKAEQKPAEQQQTEQQQTEQAPATEKAPVKEPKGC